MILHTHGLFRLGEPSSVSMCDHLSSDVILLRNSIQLSTPEMRTLEEGDKPSILLKQPLHHRMVRYMSMESIELVKETRKCLLQDWSQNQTE
jgi:hypothetical protein